MKKTAKSAVALLMSLVLICSLSAAVFAESGQTVSSVREAFSLIRSTRMFAIYDAELHRNNSVENVYYVVCYGLNNNSLNTNDPQSLGTAIRISLSLENNTFAASLAATVKNNIPVGSKVVFLGASMGGMVIQQAIANKEIKDKYDIVYSTAICSPYILTVGSKEGTLRRVNDTFDPIAYLSIPLLANPLIGNVSQETSFVSGEVHINSYLYGDCWKNYDCLGVKNGGAYMVLNKLVYSC